MTPTPEQIEQWAQEAAEEAMQKGQYHSHAAEIFNTQLALRAMAAQAEADAVLCANEARMHGHQDRNGRSAHLDYAKVASTCADAILANAPKP